MCSRLTGTNSGLKSPPYSRRQGVSWTGPIAAAGAGQPLNRLFRAYTTLLAGEQRSAWLVIRLEVFWKPCFNSTARLAIPWMYTTVSCLNDAACIATPKLLKICLIWFLVVASAGVHPQQSAAQPSRLQDNPPADDLCRIVGNTLHKGLANTFWSISATTVAVQHEVACSIMA